MPPGRTHATLFPAILLGVLALAGCTMGPSATDSPRATASTSATTSAPAGSTPASTPASTPSDSPRPAVAPDVPTGCLGLEQNQCLGVREVALSTLPARSPEVAYVRVGRFGCSTDTACPPDLASRPEGQVVVEFGDGSAPVVVGIRAAAGRIEADIQPETFFVLVRPGSGPMAGPIVETELGHCGVGSGIDVDGSFWNPVGLVEADHADYINAARATFRLVTPSTATLETVNGLRLELVRHPGPKQLELCD